MLIMLETFIISIVGGYLFYILHIPLPWLLGSITTVFIWKAWVKRPVRWDAGFRNAGLMILGYMIGAAFTLEAAWKIIGQLPSMIMVTVLLLLFSLVTAVFLARHMGVSVPTAVIGNVPGGLTQMVLLSEEMEDADMTVVAFMQTIRLMCVLFIMPMLVVHGFEKNAPLSITTVPHDGLLIHNGWLYVLLVVAVLVGLWLAIFLRFPIPYLLGPAFGIAVLMMAGVTAVPLPAVLIIVAQLFVGIHLGAGMNVSGLRNWRTILPYSIICGIGMIIFSIGTSYILMLLYPMDILTAYMSTAPGGMAEMGLTATLVNADISVVSSYQLFRILFILFFVPPVLKWWLNRYMAQRQKDSA